MSYLSNCLVLFWCCQLVLCQDVYRAAIVTSKTAQSTKNYASLIHEAAKLKADILLLETQDEKNNLESCDRCANYDEIVKTVSKAARKAAIYVAAHVYEKIICDRSTDIVRSNIIFNRNGDIISVFRKPLNEANCNSTYANSSSFLSDFGVTFGVFMEEDILNAQDMNLNNYIILGSWPRKSDELYVSQFESSWAFISKSNVISANGVYGNTEATTKSNNIIVKEINKNGNDQPHLLSSQYVLPNLANSIKLDLKLASQGFKENVCFNEFCCNFYVKTDGKGNTDVAYTLGVHTGTINIGPQTVATRGCAIVACAGSDQFCSVISSSDITFKTIAISANFSESSKQLPVLQTGHVKNMIFDQQNGESGQVNMEIHECDNILNFGIISIDSKSIDKSSDNFIDSTSYISSENVQEFFDYLWIQLRVPMFIVSIYILEMM